MKCDIIFLELNLASPLSGRNIFSSCDKNYSSHGHVDLCTENNFSEGSGIKNFGRETRPTLFTFIQILLKFDNLGGKFELSFIQADLSYLSWKLFYIKTKIKLKGFLAKERGEWRNRNTNIRGTMIKIKIFINTQIAGPTEEEKSVWLLKCVWIELRSPFWKYKTLISCVKINLGIWKLILLAWEWKYAF